MHKVGTLAGLVLAFVVYAIGALRGNSFLSLLARAGIAFASGYFMILFFGLLVVFSSSSPQQPEPKPEPKAKDKTKQPPPQQPAGSPGAFSIPEN